MARGKTKSVRITDEKVLKSTFKKRKNSLIKKVQELTILCDIISCVIIYSPVIGGRPPEIFTWPEDQEKVRAAINMYKEKEEHREKTAGWCDFLKNKKRLDISDDHHHQLNHMTMSGAGFYERRSNPAEGTLAYLNWVDSRIKAVDDRIEELVKNSGNMKLFSNDQCHNVSFDDKMMVMPVSHVDQDGNFGYGFFQQNPYVNFPQFDPYVYDQSQTMCGHGAIVPAASHFQNEITSYQQIQTPNQLSSYDPYLSGTMQRNITAAMSMNWSLQYQQQQEEEEHHSNVTHFQPQGHTLMSGLMQCPYLEWSSPDGASSSYSSSSSNLLNKTAAAEVVDDPVDYFLNAAEFNDEIQTLEDAAAGGTIPSQNGV